MKNKTSIAIRGAITLGAVVVISGAYAQGGYGEGSRIMARPSPGASATAAPGGAKTTAVATATSAQDKDFMNKAAHGGLMEVAMGKTAAQHATNADVKSFGHRMVTDHSKANDELAAIALHHGFAIPKSVAAHAWTNDKEYMGMMVGDHEADLAEFKKEASHGTDPQLKKFAADNEHVVADHLKMAKQIHSKL